MSELGSGLTSQFSEKTLSEASQLVADGEVFTVSSQWQQSQLRVESVTPSRTGTKWYERCVVVADTASDVLDIDCTCDTHGCVDAAAALLSCSGYLPHIVAGRREAEKPPMVHLGASSTQSDWFDLDIEVEVDGEKIAFPDLFSALVREDDFFTTPEGTYFSLAAKELEPLRVLIREARDLTDSSAATVSFSRYHHHVWDSLMSSYAALESDVDPEGFDPHAHPGRSGAAIADRAGQWFIRITDDVAQRDPPQRLDAQLRSYQVAGYSWLTFLKNQRVGGILADDMGLGKTLQVLAMIQGSLESRAELEDWAEAASHTQQGTGNEGQETRQTAPFLIVAPTSVLSVWQEEISRFASDLKVAVIAQTLRRSGESLAQLYAEADVILTSYALLRIDAQAYSHQRFTAVIFDEAQALKNPQSQVYHSAMSLNAGSKIALTGTPLENSLRDLWSLISLCTPGLFGSLPQFREHFQDPIEKHQDSDALGRLQRRLAPFLLRRTKDRVATELPAKQVQRFEVELYPEHRRIYDRYLQKERQRLLGLSDDLSTNRFAIMAGLNTLRQLALDTRLVGESAHASAKLDAVEELIADVTAKGHQVLVISQFTRFLRFAQQQIQARHIEVSYLDGGTSHRGDEVARFRSGHSRVFFISLKAGGFGLNLVEADYVILLDPWWNPAAEDQAIDRAHRIGQQRRVMVYRMVAANTIESKVMALQENKKALFTDVLDTSDTTRAASLTADEIRHILSDDAREHSPSRLD